MWFAVAGFNRLQPGIFEAKAPVVDGAIQLKVTSEKVEAMGRVLLNVRVVPGRLSIECQDGAPLRIERVYYDPQGGEYREPVLNEAISSLTLYRSVTTPGWTLEPPYEEAICSQENFGIFLDTVAAYAVKGLVVSGIANRV